MADRAGAAKRLWSAVRREPLAWFLLLGALLYGAWTALAPVEVVMVRIEAAALRALEPREEGLLRRPLTAAQREVVR